MPDASAQGPELTLQGVTPLGGDGSVVRFLCTMPRAMSGQLSTHAICGARRKRPAVSTVLFDSTIGETRRAVISVRLPPALVSCSLTVRIGGGLLAPRMHCVVGQDLYEQTRDSHPNAQDDPAYPAWFERRRAGEGELASERSAVGSLPSRPLLSIVCPVFRTPPEFLQAMVDSILAQTYNRWELVIVNVSGDCPEVSEVLARYDDPRVRVIEAPNRSISENTNVGIEAATGDYVGFVDHDDWVEPDALFRYAETIGAHPTCDLLFCDEDLWGTPEGEHEPRFFGARFKPSWNPDLLFTHNYVCHLLMVSRRVLELTERSAAETAGAQDYDLTLRAFEVAREICHVPLPLYHWRVHQASTAINRDSKPYALEAGRLAIQGHFDRLGIPATVGMGRHPFSYRVSYSPGDGSSLPAVARWARMPGATGESLNAAVRGSTGVFVVLMAGDASFRGDEAEGICEAAGPLLRPEVGCVGPTVLAPDGLIQAHGLLARGDGTFGLAERDMGPESIGYMSMVCHARDVSALPASCLAFRREDFDRLGGFSAELSADAAAIDFCLRLREEGKLVIVEPYGPVVQTSPLLEGFPVGDSRALLGRHPVLEEGDPYLDAALDPRSDWFELRRP